ncbi:MAG: type II secretion system protein GspN [Candidatus Binatia bacterium]
MATAAASILSRFERLVPRQMPRRSFLLYAIYTIALFLLFLVLTFPHDLVARRYAREIARETGWDLRFDDASLVPWAGYRFSNFRVQAPGAGATPWIGADRVSFRPSLQTLFGGGLSAASFYGEAYGGEFSGSTRLGETTTVDLSWQRLDLAQYPRLAEIIDGRWNGVLSGDLHLESRESLRDTEGRARLSLRDGSLTGGSAQGFTVPDLTATQGDGEVEIKGGRLEIRTLKLTGAEIDADIRGQLYLRTPLLQSVVNATLSVKPVPGAAPGIDGLLTLLNRGQKPAGGTYSFTLYGMLSQIRVR